VAVEVGVTLVADPVGAASGVLFGGSVVFVGEEWVKATVTPTTAPTMPIAPTRAKMVLRLRRAPLGCVSSRLGFAAGAALLGESAIGVSGRSLDGRGTGVLVRPTPQARQKVSPLRMPWPLGQTAAGRGSPQVRQKFSAIGISWPLPHLVRLGVVIIRFSFGVSVRHASPFPGADSHCIEDCDGRRWLCRRKKCWEHLKR
jgi:hypothetical protein